MIRILHVADLHLGWSPANPNGEQQIWNQHRNQILRKAVDVALDPSHKIDGMLIVGDLFERYNPAPLLVQQVLEQLNRLVEAGLFVITVPGNHDEITYKESVYRQYQAQWPGYLVANSKPEYCCSFPVRTESVFLYSLAYHGGLTPTQNNLSFPSITGEPGFHVGAFHGSLDWKNLPDRSLPLDSKVLSEAGYDYVALGHYHTFRDQYCQQSRLVYPGMIEGKSFSDPGVGFLLVVEWEQNQPVKLKKIEIPTVTWEVWKLDISNWTDIVQLHQTVKAKKNSQLALQLVLKGHASFDFSVESLKREWEALFFHLEIGDETFYLSGEYMKNLEKEPTLRGVFVRQMRLKIQQSQNAAEQDLLEAALLEGLRGLMEGNKEWRD